MTTDVVEARQPTAAADPTAVAPTSVEVERADAEQARRGETEVREKAVEKLVVAAAAEVPDVAGPVSRVLGQQVGSADLDGRPSAHVTIAGDRVTAAVSLSVRWPASVPAVADAVRRRIQERLAALADLRVGHVDVTVTALPVDRRRRRRVE